MSKMELQILSLRPAPYICKIKRTWKTINKSYEINKSSLRDEILEWYNIVSRRNQGILPISEYPEPCSFGMIIEEKSHVRFMYTIFQRVTKRQFGVDSQSFRRVGKDRVDAAGNTQTHTHRHINLSKFFLIFTFN